MPEEIRYKPLIEFSAEASPFSDPVKVIVGYQPVVPDQLPARVMLALGTTEIMNCVWMERAQDVDILIESLLAAWVIANVPEPPKELPDGTD